MKKALVLCLLLTACDSQTKVKWPDGLKPASPTPSPTADPTHVPFYQLPVPEPASPTPEPSPSPTPTPAFTPNPEVLAFANAMLAQRPWLEARSTDANIPPGAAPATTFLTSRVEPIVTREGETWKITFKP